MTFALVVGVTPITAFAAYEAAVYEAYDESSLSESGVPEVDIPEDAVVIDFDDLHNAHILDTLTLEEMLAEDETALAQFLEVLDLMEAQGPAIEAYNVLMEAFTQNVDGARILVYREDYAGAYVDYDTLVIQLTNISSEAIAFYRELLGSDAPITFKQVDFSLNQLIAFGEIFVEAIEAPIVRFGFDTKSNTYNITLDQNSPESIQVADSFNVHSRFFPVPISIELGEPSELMWLRGGNELRFTSAPSLPRFSVGITGTRWTVGSGASGERHTLLTSGHQFIGRPLGTRVFNSVGQEIGTLAMFRAAHHGQGLPSPANIHGDWALIDLNSTGIQQASNVLQTGERITRHIWSIPVDSHVFGTGVNTRHWQGRVERVSQSEHFRHPVNGTISGLHTARRQPAGPGIPFPVYGDSGGTIWYRTGGLNVIVGVLTGGDDAGGVWFFTPLERIGSNFSPHSWLN